MAVYKAKNGTWYISTKVHGKQCTIRGFESKRQALICYDSEIDKWKREHGFFVNGITLQDLCNDYYNYRKVNMSVGTLGKDKMHERKLIAYFGNALISSAFNKFAITKFYNDNKDNYRLLNYTKCLMRFAYERQVIDNDTYVVCNAIIILPKEKTNKVEKLKVIPPNHLKAFLDTFNDQPLYLSMFTLFAYLGVRISELLGICWDCVDLENKTITIKRQLLTNGTLTETLKTNNSYRIIPINFKIINTISVYNLKKCQKKDPFLRLYPISHTSFKRILKEHEKLAGIPLYSSHCFRHTKASEMASKCENIGDVVFCAKWLGHTTSMFLNTYCHDLNKGQMEKFL